MKHFFTFFLFLVLASTLNLYAQDEIKLDDVEIIDLGDGRLYAYKRFEKDSIIVGKVRFITGYTTEYINAEFNKGFAVGKWEYYKDNRLNESVSYSDGYLDGERASYYADGTVKVKTPYSKGIVNGTIIRYYPDGKKEYELGLLNGVNEGAERFYDESGKVRSETNYKKGKPEGKSYSNISGSSRNYLLTSYYKDGLLDGDYSEVFEGGIVKMKGKYLQGKKEGIWEYNKDDGIKKLTEGYKEGELVKKITYYANGNIDTERNYKSNKEDGVTKKYTLEGAIKSEQSYVDGKQVGKQIIHFTTGGAGYIETSNYNAKGQKDGDYSEIFSENNKIKSQGKYVNGQKDGKWIYGYKNGTVYREETYNNGNLIDRKNLE